MNDAILELIAWNVYIGNRPARVRAALQVLIKELNPDAFVLMEARNMFGPDDEDEKSESTDKLHDLGYQVVQLRPRPLRPGNQSAQANIAILVRDGIPIRRRRALRMTVFWRGPKHGWPQDPRVYRSVLIKIGGKWWKLAGAHTPFGVEARLESRNRLRRWLSNITRRPSVLALDANMSLHDFREGIATPGGALAAGDGIDLVAYKNAVMLLAKNLGRRISDHPAMYYRFKAK